MTKQKNTTTSAATSVKNATWLQTPLAGRIFMAVCGTLLLATVVAWSLLGAGLHQANADQLIDTYLFENPRTFAEAWFPGAHTFLLKWPLFALMSLLGAGQTVFIVFTLLMALATVGGLVFVLYRIDRRPYMFGLYCLALASVLLLVPAQPYAGALLPANFAMTTTRNLEYLVFLLVLWFAATQPKLKSWATFGVGAALMVLIASDKLFAVLAMGSCLFAVAYYLVKRRTDEAARALGWTAMVVSAFGAATALLLLIEGLNITGVGAGEAASPFGLITSIQQIALAVIYGAGAFLSNFGANPIHGVTVIRDMPAALLKAMQHPSIIAYLVNGLLFAAGLYGVVRLLIRRQPETKKKESGRNQQWLRLSVLLIGAALAATAVYMLTDHYYPVDARYMAIALFAVVIAAATYWRTQPLRLRVVGTLALLIAIAIPLGTSQSMREYIASAAAMVPRTAMAARAADEVERRDVERLVGDYWDVAPVKGAMKPEAARNLIIAPVDNCVTPRPVLNSKAWFDVPAKTSTAFLAVRDGSAEAGPNSTVHHQANTATYGGCSLEKIVGSYGVPSERIRIDDTVNDNGLPDVLMLLYPSGTKTGEEAAAERKAADTPSAPVRKNMTALPDMADCNAGVSMQVVAHEDDDILFMNPDVHMSLKAGRCIRTVYITAGNAGENVNYWGGREKGAKAAYAQMLGHKNDWRDEIQFVGNHPMTVSYLAGMPKVSLVFMRLPDGNLRGEGFPGDNYASLRNLLGGSIQTIGAVDKSTTYTQQELTETLLGIMNIDQPDEIRTLGSGDHADGDHADHHDAGVFADRAAAAYASRHTITHYLGYPVRGMSVNLSPDIIAAKQAAFLAYAKHDGAVCRTAAECEHTSTYGSYLKRQYTPDMAAAPQPPTAESAAEPAPAVSAGQ